AGGPHPGYDDYHRALLQLIHELKLEDHITLYGPIAEPWDWYPKIDIFISNSYSEGLQVAPMETMASGCYCLSHNWEGSEELLPAESLFYTSGDLIERIEEFAGLPESEQQARRAAGRARACEKFDIQDTAVRIRQVLEETADTRRN